MATFKVLMSVKSQRSFIARHIFKTTSVEQQYGAAFHAVLGNQVLANPELKDHFSLALPEH